MKQTACCLVAALVVLALVGCSTKKSATEKNFAAGINAYLSDKGQLCLGLASKWPIDMDPREQGSLIGRWPQMAALQKIGLARSYETQTSYTPVFSDRPMTRQVLRYELTNAGKKFYRESTIPPLGNVLGDVCYGRQAVDKIVRWQGPLELGDYKEVRVFYTYKIENLADWARNPDIQKAFPGTVLAIQDAGKEILDQALVLSSDGWQSRTP